MGDGLNVTINNLWQDKKCIYLDWNVIKYMSSPRAEKNELDVDMLNLIEKLKSKYIFPYSEGHIKDRISRYKEEYRVEIENDFAFAEKINDNYMMIPNALLSDGFDDNRYIEIAIVQKSMTKYFDAYISMLKTENVKAERLAFENFSVDLSAIDENHPLYEFLEKSGGKVTPVGLYEFINDMFYCIFNDNDVYKKLRAYTKTLNVEHIMNQPMKFKARLQTDRLLYYMFPMIESINDDEDTLAHKWKAICERWFSMNGENLSFEMLMKEGYSLLDFHPLFNEKLKKGKNTADNIVRDGIHCYYATRAKYFVSEDEKTRKKTAFMYKAFGIKTKVVSEDEFVRIFTVT